jgi:hypothetical protein
MNIREIEDGTTITGPSGTEYKVRNHTDAGASLKNEYDREATWFDKTALRQFTPYRIGDKVGELTVIGWDGHTHDLQCSCGEMAGKRCIAQMRQGAHPRCKACSIAKSPLHDDRWRNWPGQRFFDSERIREI